MKKLLVMTLIILIQTNMIKKKPDAIRCGADNSCCPGAIYFIHAASDSSQYRQIFSGEDRGVFFNRDGGYSEGFGHYDSRKGCENKSLDQLEREGRTFHFENSENNAKTAKLEEDVRVLNTQMAQMLEESKKINTKNAELTAKIAKLE